MALWIACGVAAFLVARIVPLGRSRSFYPELLTAIVSAFLLGLGATALDFGGWAEPDWRAASFVFFGSAAILGTIRLKLVTSDW